MNTIALRFRFLCRLPRGGFDKRRIFSSETASTGSQHKEAVSSAGQSIIADISTPPPPPPPEASSTVSHSKSLKFLMYGVVAAVTGITGIAGYVSYAYNLDEIQRKAKAFKESTSHTKGDDLTAIDKFGRLAYSTAMTVPVKAIDLYLELRELIEEQVRGYTEPTSEKLLPDLHPAEQHVFTLVLDLNETLLYTDWKRDRGWRTFKRPGVDAFLEHLAKFYEIVVYSDQMDMYVGPVCDRLDPNHYIRFRLARGATKYENGKHFRDLSKLNRDPRKILYVSGHAFDSSLQPENSVPIKPYKLEQDDTALIDLIPFLEYVARNSPPDIRQVLASYEREDIAKEFLERSKEYQRRMQEQRQQNRLWRR